MLENEQASRINFSSKSSWNLILFPRFTQYIYYMIINRYKVLQIHQKSDQKECIVIRWGVQVLQVSIYVWQFKGIIVPSGKVYEHLDVNDENSFDKPIACVKHVA